MWRVVQSNRTEELFQAFLHWIHTPLKDPFIPEVVVVQDMGMARWLTHQLARHRGIAANIRFLVPAEWAHEAYEAWLGENINKEAWRPQILLWHIYRLLPQCLSRPSFEELNRYLGRGDSEIQRYQLAERIAKVFDRYLLYRPNLILTWEQEGPGSDGWQAELWRLLAETISCPHQARIHTRFLDLYEKKEIPRRQDKLPQRVSLFGVTALAPVHLELTQATASWTDVALFYLNPSQHYWGDVRQEKVSFPPRNETDTPEFLQSNLNPLMVSWAQAGSFFFDQIQEIPKIDEDHFVFPSADTTLGSIQEDLLELRDRRIEYPEDRAILPDEWSIQIHGCHSPMREVQVLHDQIAHLLDTLPGLKPEDVVVMAPDIEKYAAYVEAVFSTRDAPKIRWNLSERKPPFENPLLETILEFFDLPHRRFTATEVFSLLEIPAVARRFDFDEQGIQRVRLWIQETGIRWGLHAAMRREEGLPEYPENTWRAGLDRLFAGYAMPPREIFVQDILAYPHVHPGDARWIGGLQDLLDTLEKWRALFQEPATSEEWQSRLNQLLEDFFLPDPETEPVLQIFRNAVDTFRSNLEWASVVEPIPASVVQSHLRSLLENTPSIRRFLSGGVTFCNMVPMRIIPFRVVCLLGMNDAEFPRTDRPPRFDIMAQHPQPGDRLRRSEDKYLFLEALLSARDVFYVSYISHDIRDNSIKVPSVVVSELLDYIDRCWTTKDGSAPSSVLVTHHPLQPFSPRIYGEEDTSEKKDRIFSYDSLWLEAARIQESPDHPPFFHKPLNLPTEEPLTVDLEDFIRFFLDPGRWFLEKVLGMTLTREELLLDDDEPFALSGLDNYHVAREIIESELNGEDPTRLFLRLKGRGILPAGPAGKLDFEKTRKKLRDFVQTVRAEAGQVRTRKEVNIPLPNGRITGWLSDVTEWGRLQYRPADVKGKDMVRLWIGHLILCASSLRESPEPKSVHIGKKDIFRLRSVPDPQKELERLLSLWIQGQKAPLCFFPDSGWAYARKAAGNKKEPEDPFLVAGNAWNDEYNRRGDRYSSVVRILYRGQSPDAEEFKKAAHAVFGPVFFEHLEHEKL